MTDPVRGRSSETGGGRPGLDRSTAVLGLLVAAATLWLAFGVGPRLSDPSFTWPPPDHPVPGAP